MVDLKSPPEVLSELEDKHKSPEALAIAIGNYYLEQLTETLNADAPEQERRKVIDHLKGLVSSLGSANLDKIVLAESLNGLFSESEVAEINSLGVLPEITPIVERRRATSPSERKARSAEKKQSLREFQMEKGFRDPDPVVEPDAPRRGRSRAIRGTGDMPPDLRAFLASHKSVTVEYDDAIEADAKQFIGHVRADAASAREAGVKTDQLNSATSKFSSAIRDVVTNHFVKKETIAFLHEKLDYDKFITALAQAKDDPELREELSNRFLEKAFSVVLPLVVDSDGDLRPELASELKEHYFYTPEGEPKLIDGKPFDPDMLTSETAPRLFANQVVFQAVQKPCGSKLLTDHNLDTAVAGTIANEVRGVQSRLSGFGDSKKGIPADDAITLSTMREAYAPETLARTQPDIDTLEGTRSATLSSIKATIEDHAVNRTRLVSQPKGLGGLLSRARSHSKSTVPVTVDGTEQDYQVGGTLKEIYDRVGKLMETGADLPLIQPNSHSTTYRSELEGLVKLAETKIAQLEGKTKLDEKDKEVMRAYTSVKDQLKDAISLCNKMYVQVIHAVDLPVRAAPTTPTGDPRGSTYTASGASPTSMGGTLRRMADKEGARTTAGMDDRPGVEEDAEHEVGAADRPDADGVRVGGPGRGGPGGGGK